MLLIATKDEKAGSLSGSEVWEEPASRGISCELHIASALSIQDQTPTQSIEEESSDPVNRRLSVHLFFFVGCIPDSAGL
jgi:hypothetical protein